MRTIMKIKFLQSYRGQFTKEAYFQAGDVVDCIQFKQVNGIELVKAGRAEEIKPLVKEKKADPVKKVAPKSKAVKK